MNIPIPRTLLHASLLSLAIVSIPVAQEACLKGCAYPPYPGLRFTLGDGFVAKGGEEVKVTHFGFLGSVYNNDGVTPRKVGVPDYIGELYAIDPVTGEEKFLFRNQADWVTHAHDSGKAVSLGVYPKGAPVVFKYVNVDGKTNGYKTFPRYSGANVAGTYDFSADPALRALAIHGKPRPVSGGSWNWEGNNYNKWCVAADVPGTGEKQFQFEDADDRIFNDIVFRVSGVALVSESLQLDAPLITGAQGADGNHRVTLAAAPGAANQGAKIFYTLDGSTPTFDASGMPLGSTLVYTGPIEISKSTSLKAIAFKAPVSVPGGGLTRFKDSPVAEAVFPVTRRQLSAPTANPAGGPFTASLTVTLSQAEGAPIRYRLCDPGVACPDPDANASLYAGPLILNGSKVIKAMAIRPPELNSAVAVWTFMLRYNPIGAVYLDRDGDGRIESAHIDFSAPLSSQPDGVLLEDPFTPGRKRDVPLLALRLDPANPSRLLADFAAQPFAPGTGFAAGPFGALSAQSAESTPFDTMPFMVRDGAGPVALSAEALVRLDSGAAKALTVRFSEPLATSGIDGALPFRVRRGGEDITSRLRLLSVESVGLNTWRFAFSADFFPIPGDSLQATSLAKDITGNPSNMSFFIPVGGRLPLMTADLDVVGGGCVRGNDIPAPVAWKIPLNVIAPRAVSSTGCVDARVAVDCLDCRTGEWRRLDPRRADGENIPAGPEIKVKSRWPFSFDLSFYNTAGEFVNSARGKVSEEMLAGMPADSEGNRTVSLQWYPVSGKGGQAATGAYIAKGTLTVDPPAEAFQLQGVPVRVEPVTRAVSLRFGYMRD